jgi:hypothetical protein
MERTPLIVVIIIAAILLVLSSLTNIVGYQTVQASYQREINNENNQKELLFQTIYDITNNREIQKSILKSRISKEGFIRPEVKFSIFTPHVLTKNQLKHMYFIGLMLSKIINKPRMHSMIEQYQFGNERMQKEINAVIEKDANLKREITQLSASECDCENENTSWNFPIICMILFPIFYFDFLLLLLVEAGLHYPAYLLNILLAILLYIGSALNCFWV